MIYFIQSGPDGFIKIGHGKAPHARKAEINLASPYPLVTLATQAGGFDEEQKLHQRFKFSRVKGEWFRPTPDLLAFIEDVKRNQEVVRDIVDLAPSAACTPECRATVFALANALRETRQDAKAFADERELIIRGTWVAFEHSLRLFRRLFGEAYTGQEGLGGLYLSKDEREAVIGRIKRAGEYRNMGALFAGHEEQEFWEDPAL